MKILHLILRLGLGLLLLTFGFNKFFWFLADFDFTGFPEAEHLFKALRYSGQSPTGKGYLMDAVGITEIVVGVLLILKKWVPFALVMLVPISINLVLFHLFVNLPNMAPAALVLLVNGYLMYVHRGAYRPLFSSE
ncbi:DoxX family membrane protein [Altibacter sp. HG106]|uniref:DoxX family membrane protein n=1 Tax=Altibacter sp. HG106 TaxID=3023937 RepID=UPI00234FC76D|nr:DoxX family membrane protein [Altibacter sp. HG106]MDC7994936.1 DoxX family membrane protein [Altibacter sp. HG106]